MRFLKIPLLTVIALFLVSVPGLRAQALPPYGTVSGRVIDTSGNGLAGVTIALIGDRTGTQIAQTDAGGNYLFSYGANNRLTVIASKSGNLLSPLSIAFISSSFLTGNWRADFEAVFLPIPLPLYSPPVLLTEENSLRALALDSITRMRDPFPVFTPHNFSTGGRSRIMLFAVNAELLQGETASAITVTAESSSQTYNLPVESTAKVPGYDWLRQIVVTLPDGMGSAGEVSVSIKLHNVVSNKVRVRVTP